MDKIKKAVDELQEFLEADLYSKFRPEEKVNGETLCREDVFGDEEEFRLYLQDHFDILRTQLGVKE